MMKRQPIRWLMVMSLVAVATVGVFGVMAQPDDDKRPGPPPRYELGHVFPPPLLEQLNLTSDQQAELEIIQQELKSKLEKLLTDEQKQQVENFRPRRPGGPGGPDGKGPPPPPDRPAAGRKGPDRRDRAASSAAEAVPPAKLQELPLGVTRAPVVFSGGHETDPRDGGRPVVLIAAALEVAPEVFRDAFSRVRPARGGEPEPAQVRQNKAVLLEALGKQGVTNERLDTVSDYYRYPPGRNSLWKNKPAVANALVKDGAVIGYEIVSGGAGYTSAPTVSVPKVKGAVAKVEISFSKQMESNGAVSSIVIPDGNAN